jgi:hypothetical protein
MNVEMRDELAGGIRRRPLGEGMVTPTRQLVVRIDGRSETLRPGRDRFSPAHAIVVADPTAFRPVRAGDIAVRLRLAQLARARRTRPQSTGRPRAPRHLGASQAWRPGRRTTSPSWRLG